MEHSELYRGRFLRVMAAGHWEYVDRTTARGAVVLVAVTDAGKLLLVEQFRIPVMRPVIELPAGLAGDIAGEADESLETAASRELEEETGYRARSWRRLCGGPPSPGLATEFTTFLLAEEVERFGSGGGDAEEKIIVHEIPLAEVVPWLEGQERRGAFVDPKVFAGLYFLRRTGC